MPGRAGSGGEKCGLWAALLRVNDLQCWLLWQYFYEARPAPVYDRSQIRNDIGSVDSVMTANPPLVTGLLRKWRDGDESAKDQLLPLIHDALHRLAHQYVNRERRGHTL